ncbi:hypothetical protein BGZ99_002954 [Dissophora globulifera]|uniref:Restriction endonuclease type IV Mrr domain-containing protein n=1 Tax=Dissophora globulifera TaxID=979702 RepID=A0A9P6UWP7_9FUNG|nr:hypothetical protein BGZ99_002954 [Dissophora globulifera]
MPYNDPVLKERQGGVRKVCAHNDLESFESLPHNVNSTLYRGTLFEYQTQEILRKHLGIYTQRSAGNNDLGVDLRGTWFLPLSASPQPGENVRHLKVIVQCKMSSTKIGPKFVRELQGSLSYETQPTMAILAISSDFTKRALLPYAKSLWPMALVVIDAEKNECRKIMWNQAAEKVMHGVQIGTQWISDDDGGVESRPVLCFNGHVIERLPGPYLNDGIEDQVNDYKSLDLDYNIPNWNISTKPEYLNAVHKSKLDCVNVDEDDIEWLDGDSADDIAPDCHPIEILSWNPPPSTEEIISDEELRLDPPWLALEEQIDSILK